jgi:hypothetical protein
MIRRLPKVQSSCLGQINVKGKKMEEEIRDEKGSREFFP